MIRSTAATLDALGICDDLGRVKASRRLSAISITVPIFGSLGAVAYGMADGYSTSAWVVAGGSFFLTALGIGVGLHRHFTHGAFKTSNVIRGVLAVFGGWALQGPIDRWVADHRRHHRFTDEPYDPHSPYWDGNRKIESRLAGLIHAHIGWMLTGLVSDEERYAPDIRACKITAWCSSHYWLLAATSLLLPSAIGYLVEGEVLSYFLLAGCARVALLHQITWSVNSFGHMSGSKVTGSNDESRDNLVLAVLLLGEGLHSFHHRYPSAAVNRPLWLDFGGGAITFMERLGIVWGVKRW